METIEINPGTNVNLNIKVSSDAIFTSHVKLENTIVKQSKTNNFTVNVGNIDNIDENTLSSFTSFFVNTGNIDSIKSNTTLNYTLKFGDFSKKLESTITKVSDNYFTGFFIIKIKKK